MEISNFRGFSEPIGMEDYSFNFQFPMNSFDDQMNSFGDVKDHVFDYYKPVMEPCSRPAKQVKTSSWKSSITTDHSLMNLNQHHQQGNQLVKEEMAVSSKINHGFTPRFQYGSEMNNSGGFDNDGVGGGRINSKKTFPAQDHILAERKRREKLSQRFIALSALVPGLKKLDKASVLGDAIKHMKTLQEKVKTLEDQAKKRPNTESVVFVKRFEVLPDDREDNNPVHEQLPEIEARVSGNDVLIRIHCEKTAGVIQKTIAEIEKLHLSVVNTTAMTFAGYALDITVIAQMDKEFVMTMKDFMMNLRSALKQIV